MEELSPGTADDEENQDGEADVTYIANTTSSSSQDAPNQDSNPSCELCGKVFIGYAHWTNWNKHVELPPDYCIRLQAKAARSAIASGLTSDQAPRIPTEGISLQDRLVNMKGKVFLPDHIPTSIRHAVAEELVTVVTFVANTNSVEAWTTLLVFGYRVLGQSRTAGQKKSSKSITDAIQRNIGDKRLPEVNAAKMLPQRKTATRRPTAKDIARKLQDGNVSGCVRMLAQEDAMCEITEEVITTMKQKHPVNAPITAQSPKPAEDQAPQITQDEVKRLVKSFPGGSSGGCDGFRPNYLKELSAVREPTCDKLLNALNKVLKVMIAGNVPAEIIPILYGAVLVPLRKKDGGLRPIAIGTTLRRLAGKLVSSRSLHLNNLFMPSQLGFATKNSCEVPVHAAQTYIERRLDSDVVHAFLKIDSKNAFNCVDRNQILQSALQHLPQYYSFIWQCYSSKSNLMCGRHVIESKSGIQQGDPLGPFLYCLATRETHSNMISELQESYLDDDVPDFPHHIVLSDFLQLEACLRGIGLEVNLAKCEVFLFGGMPGEQEKAFDDFGRSFPIVRLVAPDDLEYLGLPLHNSAFSKAFDKAARKD